MDIDLIRNSTSASDNNIGYKNGPRYFGIEIVGTSNGNFTESTRPYLLRVAMHEFYNESHIILMKK